MSFGAIGGCVRAMCRKAFVRALCYETTAPSPIGAALHSASRWPQLYSTATSVDRMPQFPKALVTNSRNPCRLFLRSSQRCATKQPRQVGTSPSPLLRRASTKTRAGRAPRLDRASYDASMPVSLNCRGVVQSGPDRRRERRRVRIVPRSNHAKSERPTPTPTPWVEAPRTETSVCRTILTTLIMAF